MNIRRPYTYTELKALNAALEDELNFQLKDKLYRTIAGLFCGGFLTWLFMSYSFTG